MKRPLSERIFGGFLILMSIGAYFYFGSEMLRSQRCTVATIGELAMSYTVNEKSRNGVVTSTTYDVNYSFDVGGRPYQGEDTLPDEPTELEVTVYYNPANPAENQLVAKNNVIALLIGTSFLAAGVYIAFFPRSHADLSSSVGGVPKRQPARPRSTADVIAAARGEAATNFSEKKAQK